MRRARFAVGVIAWLTSGAACGPDLPDQIWQSPHVRYFSRAGDVEICPAILDELEQHAVAIADALGIDPDPTIVSYYKFNGATDFQSNAECGAGAAGCAVNATVRSPEAFDRQDLIRAYLAPYGLPPPLLAEGASAALSCERHPRPTGSWRDVYGADASSWQLRAAGAWLVGAMLRMFPGVLMVDLYASLQPNADADTFADLFESRYEMPLDAVWDAAINAPEQPMRCVWECGRPAFPADGQSHPLVPACGSGSTQLSIDLSGGGLSRWRLDGGGQLFVRSCDGFEEPEAALKAWDAGAGLLASLAPGRYFIDATVPAGTGSSLAVGADPGAALSSAECALAPTVPDALDAFTTLSLFYPSSEQPRFTRFATGTDHVVLLSVPVGSIVAGALCTSCDPQSCESFRQLPTTVTPQPGWVLQLAPSPAVTVTIEWL